MYVTHVTNRSVRPPEAWRLLARKHGGEVHTVAVSWKLYSHRFLIPQVNAQKFLDEWVKLPRY